MRTMANVPQAADAVECGPVWVSPTEMCEVRIRGRPVTMSLTNLRMLAYLIRAQGKVIPRDELYRKTIDHPIAVASRSVDVRILQLRRSLGPLGRFLLTVPKRGYRIDTHGLAQAR